MHLSMHNWMRPEPLESTLQRLARFGFESIELSGEPGRYRPEETCALLEKYNVRCWGGVTLMLGERSLLASDERQRATSIQYTKDCVDLVASLGGGVLTVIPGTIGKLAPDAPAESEWEWAVSSLREIHDHAQPLGVRLAIEPLMRFETYFINRGAQAMALATEVGSECGVCLDTFHLNIEEGDPYQAIRDCGPRLVNVHVADNNRMPAGMGSYDWGKIVQTLRSVRYDGALAAEFVATVDRTPANPFPNALEPDLANVSPEQRAFVESHGSDLWSTAFYDWLTEAHAEHLLPIISSTVGPGANPCPLV